MKLLILLSVISTVVGQLGQENRYPGFRTNNPPNNVIAKCTFWRGVETSICHTFRFKVDNRTMKDFRPQYNMYGGYDELFGNAQMQPEVCSDALEKDKYWKTCPSLYRDDSMELLAGTYRWLELSGCASNETKCQLSCNLCGEENYITAAMEVEKKTNLRCLKIMDHFPFSCMEKRVVETLLPSLIVIYLNNKVLEDADDGGNNPMCVTFNFRRRASADCPLNELSEVYVCTEKSKSYQLFDASPNPNCANLDPGFTPSSNELRNQLDDKNNCMFNIWRKAFFVFYNADPVGNDNLMGTEFQIVVYRKVDHIDIDEVEIFPGDCTTQIDALDDGLDYDTENTLVDGVFLGIHNIE